MADDGPTVEPQHTESLGEEGAEPTRANTWPAEGTEVESDVLRVLLGRTRGREHDLRVIKQLSRVSVLGLSVRLREAKRSKYELLQRHPDLDQHRDVHPQGGKLTRLERQIGLVEEAIRSKELTATEATGTSPEFLEAAASYTDEVQAPAQKMS